jgi:hypothetical protein
LVVRVKLRVKSRLTSRSLELAVLAESGAESAKPCIVVDESIARERSCGRALRVECLRLKRPPL